MTYDLTRRMMLGALPALGLAGVATAQTPLQKPGERIFQPFRIEDDERAASGSHRGEIGEAALQPAVVEFAIVLAVIGEAPAEGCAVKGFCRADIGDVEFDIVDAAVVFRVVSGHLISP